MREAWSGIYGDNFASGTAHHQHSLEAISQHFHKLHICNIKRLEWPSSKPPRSLQTRTAAPACSKQGPREEKDRATASPQHGLTTHEIIQDWTCSAQQIRAETRGRILQFQTEPFDFTVRCAVRYSDGARKKLFPCGTFLRPFLPDRSSSTPKVFALFDRINQGNLEIL